MFRFTLEKCVRTDLVVAAQKAVSNRCNRTTPLLSGGCPWGRARRGTFTAASVQVIGLSCSPLGEARSARHPPFLPKLCTLPLIHTVVKCGLITFHRTLFLNCLRGTIQAISAMATYFGGVTQWSHCVFCLWKCTYARRIHEMITLLYLSRVLSALEQAL